MFWEVKDDGFEFNCSEGEAAQEAKLKRCSQRVRLVLLERIAI